MKDVKNMQWFPNRPPDKYYMNVDIGIKLYPPIMDKYLRQLAAGHSVDAMKVFLAKALVECMKLFEEYGYSDIHMKIYNMAKEVDLDFVDERNMEADAPAAEPEGRTNTGVSK